MDRLADEAERLQQCVVFGCDEEDVQGISTSETLEKLYFGTDGIDESLKAYVAELRTR